MNERIRLIVDTEERYRRAVRIAAARRGCSTSDIVNKLIIENLATEVAEAERAIAEEKEPDAKRTRKA